MPILHHEVGEHTRIHTHTHAHTYAVPNYLRTKLELDLEVKQSKLALRAREEEANVKNKIKNFNKLLTSSLEKIAELKELIDDQKSKKGQFCIIMYRKYRKPVFDCLNKTKIYMVV